MLSRWSARLCRRRGLCSAVPLCPEEELGSSMELPRRPLGPAVSLPPPQTFSFPWGPRSQRSHSLRCQGLIIVQGASQGRLHLGGPLFFLFQAMVTLSQRNESLALRNNQGAQQETTMKHSEAEKPNQEGPPAPSPEAPGRMPGPRLEDR